MRTTTINGIKIDYPDEISFAFNRELIIINTTQKTEITISANSKTFTDICLPIGNKIIKDISYYLRLLFTPEINAGIAGLSNMMLNCTVAIKIESTPTTNFTFTTRTVWGALGVGETFNPSRREHTFFNAFPQMFSIYAEAGTVIWRSTDNSSFTNIGTVANTGINNYAILPTANNKVAYRFGGTGDTVINTFDFTFDNTFRLKPGIAADAEVIFNVNNCADGLFLRWIDRQGFYQYYMISRTQMSFTTQAEGNPITVDYTAFGRWFYNIINQNKSERQTLSGYVSLANKEDIYTLTSLFTSPLVWAYLQSPTGVSDWLPVLIQPATNIITPATLQDLNINIVFPQTQIQSL